MNNSFQSMMTPLDRKPLSHVVVEKIKDGIIRGALKPGEFLPPEAQLADSLGVGKSSVREAIKMLEALGVVEVCKGQGSRIRTDMGDSLMNPLVFQLLLVSGENQDKLWEFRRAIELGANYLAIEHATQEDLDALKSLQESRIRDFARGIADPKNDLEFHLTIYRGTHNPFYEQIGKSVMELFYPSLVISNRDEPANVMEDHSAILDALLRRDYNAMTKCVEASLEKWRNHSLIR